MNNVIERANFGNSGPFLENRGQWDNGLNYIARTGFGHVGLGLDGIYYHLLDMTSADCPGPTPNGPRDMMMQGKDRRQVDAAVIKVGFHDASRVIPIGSSMVADNTNFFLGNDPSSWATGVRSFESVRYPDLWEGIDLVLYSKDGRLKYDIVIGPGADPADITFKVEGHTGLSAQESKLVIDTPIGMEITDSGLCANYGDGGREGIGVTFVLTSPNTYGFELEGYDRSRPVIIDPLVFSTYYGGTSYDTAQDMDMDSDGNLYVVGYTDSYDFPITKSAYQTSSAGFNDVFVFKMSGDGRTVFYSTYIGGTSEDLAYAIIVDTDGCAYVTGSSASTDFPTTEGAYDREHSTTEYDSDIIILKLNAQGSSLVFSTFVVGSDYDEGYDIALDPSNDVYVVGSTASDDFPTTSGCYDGTHNGWTDIVILTLSSDGSTLDYSTYLGGDDDEWGQGMYTNSADEVYLTGYTYSYDFPVTANVRHHGGADVVVAKMDLRRSTLLYSNLIGGDDDDIGVSIVVDDQGCSYVSGLTLGGARTIYPTTIGAYDTSFNGLFDCFVTKLDKKGSSLLYSTFIGGTDADGAADIRLDKDHKAYVCGVTYSLDFPVTPGAEYASFQGGSSDAVTFELDLNGASLLYSTYFGGGSDEVAFALLLDPTNNVLIAGESDSLNLPTTTGTVQTTPAGSYDCFVSKMKFIAKPSEPRSLYAIGGVGYISLNWTEPSFDGGLPILFYTIYRGLTDSSLTRYRTSYVLLFNDTSVLAGTVYFYSVSANSSAVEGFPSNVVSAMPLGRPSAPRDLTLIAGERYVDLDWDAPPLDGGSPLAGYRIYRGTSEGTLAALAEVSPANTYFRDETAAMGVKYYYAVTAFNAVGESSRTDILNATMPDVPSMPLELTVVWGDSYVHLSWKTPAKSGGLLLNGFKVYRYDASSPVTLLATLPGSVMSFNDTAVTNGVEYIYNVTAMNGLGESLPAVISATPLGTPGKPKVLPPSTGDGFVHLYWQAPETDGGSPILGYRVFQLDDQSLLQLIGEVKPTVLDHNMTGLINGRIYYCYIIAFNAIGLGKRSEMMSGVPLGPPGPPVDLSAVPGNGFVQLSWARPLYDGGSPIMRYYVLRGTDQASWEDFVEIVNMSSLSYNDTKVLNGVTYRYVVRSMTSIGLSLPSNEVSAKPLGVPSPPRNLTLNALSNTVNISWLPPLRDGGSPILGYRLLKGDVPTSLEAMQTVDPGTGHYQDTSVKNGRVYYYSLIAFNIKGNSEPTPVASIKPIGTPSAPRNVRTEVSGPYIKLLWEPPEDNGGSPITGYDIYRSDNGGTYVKVGSVGPSMNTYLDKDVRPGVKYSYTVKAQNSVGDGESSAFVLVELEKEDGTGGGLGWLLWLLGALLVMGLTIAIVLLIVLRKKNPPDAVEPPTPDPTLDALLYPPGMQMPVPPAPPQQQLYGTYYGQQPQVQPPTPVHALGPAGVEVPAPSGPMDASTGGPIPAEIHTPEPTAEETAPFTEAPPVADGQTQATGQSQTGQQQI